MSILAGPSYNVVFRMTATEKNSFFTMLNYVFVLSVHAVGTLQWRGSSLIPPVYQPVTSSKAIYCVYLSESLQLIDPNHLLTGGSAAAVTTLQTVLQQTS